MTTKQEQWLNDFKEFLDSDEHREIIIQKYHRTFGVGMHRARVVVNEFWMQQIQAK